MLLTHIPKNTLVVVKEVPQGNYFLMQQGLNPGESLRVISNYSSQPILVEVRNTFVAIDKCYAAEIEVEIKK